MAEQTARPSTGHPPARREAVVDELHGRVVADPYRWLEDGESAECRTWLADQEELFTRHARTWRCRDAFAALLEELTAEGGAAVPVLSVPVVRGGRRFLLRRAPGQQLPVLVVTDADGGERTLLNPLDLDASATTTLDAWRPSWTGDLVAYQVSHRGEERPTLRVLDAATGRTVDGPLRPGRATPVAWLPDDTGFYYVDTPDGSSARRLRLHLLGDASRDDAVLFTVDLPQLSVATSPDGRWMMLSAAPGATSGNLLWLAETATDHLAPRLVHDGTGDGTRAVVKFGPDGRIYAVTDADAPFGRLCAVDPDAPDSARWRTLIASAAPAVLTDCVVLRESDSGRMRLLVSYSRHGAADLVVHDADGTRLGRVPLPGPGTVLRLSAPPSGAAEAWFGYTDFVTPPSVYRFRLGQGVSAARPSVRDRGPWPAVRQVTYPSHDGTPVRMHLVGLPGDGVGPRPTLLTAYGGFGASSVPGYSPAVLAWVRAGGLYAVAHVRGGGEGGTAWHAAGRGRHKPNAVADFVSAARWLVARGWTSPDRLALRGASHSGLLVAAALARHPDLCAAAVCSDAVTDMVRYPRFGLGRLWTEEFGTAEDPEQLDVLLGYSPYHRVQDGAAYPAVLFTCARTDPRVDSLHTRKMAAALQHATSARRPVLLRCEADVGHGARSVARWIGLQADILAFCATHTGLRLPHADDRC
ncbi:S9 family peptidase [Thermobifida halotolerans]|uniref:prolyl oligopeptidase n=1 Tax=Thermobifida halotolerans TaxID=483545 RepID=A0A399G4D5_9ACTN|nr:prolyl oligopeptidase family serine peptidase [Thermobifida halotolerans]UOE20974.1 S9 family peptidase [Thermobifida halotolerans]